MYAHQVIDDLKKIRIKHADGDKFIESNRKMIFDSIKYHINSESIRGYAEAQTGKIIFSDPEYQKYARLPNNPMWIDTELNTGKFAVIIYEENNNWHIYTYAYFKDIKSWIVLPLELQLFSEDFSTSLISISAVNQKCNHNGFYKDCYECEYKSKYCEAVEDMVFRIAGIIQPTILLLNCSNIQTKDNLPSEKLNKSRLRKNKMPLFTYKTLEIKPLSKKELAGDNKSCGMHNRIHLCRGHFKEYTEEKPLFGKCTGLYWWQPHVRGQNRDGVVMKDYEITTEPEE